MTAQAPYKSRPSDRYYLNFNDNPILPVPDDAPVAPPFIDVDNDRFIAPIDAVLVINWPNSHPVGAAAAAAVGEGETLPLHDAAAYTGDVLRLANAGSGLQDDLLAILALDGDGSRAIRRRASRRR